MTKKEKTYLIIIAAFLCLMAVMILISRSGKHRAPADIPTSAQPAETTVVTEKVNMVTELEKIFGADVIQDGLRDMGVLVTGEYYFTDVISYSSIKKLLDTDITLGFTETSFVGGYDGSVTAGIDLTAARVAKDTDSKQITVTLPHAEVLTVAVDPDSFVLYSERSGLGNPLSADDFNQSLSDLEQKARTKAVDKGLLERAETNGENVIRNFIGGLLDAERYNVVINWED